jgi:flagellar biosynthesis/type III secretory pathway protein FliH
MENLTGEPAREVRVAIDGDGLSFEPETEEAVDPAERLEPTLEADLFDAVDAESDSSALQLEILDAHDSESFEESNQSRLPEDNDSSHAVSGEGIAEVDDALTDPFINGAADPLNAGGVSPSQPELIEPMISVADHQRSLEAELRAARESSFAEGLAKGIEQGSEQTRSSLKAQIDRSQQALDALIRAVTEASLDAVTLHAPLRRLAVHLAIELVRGELSQSSEAIGRLIETCLAEIDRAPGDHLVLAMHPDDLDRWVQRPAISLERVDLRADPSIGPGSVRLSAGDTVIEDLIEHRLAVLATRVLGESAAQRLPRLGALRARGFADGDIADVG